MGISGCIFLMFLVFITTFYEDHLKITWGDADWDQPWSFIQSSLYNLCTYVQVAAILVLFVPGLCGNDVNDDPKWMYVGLLWNLAYQAILWTIAASNFESFVTSFSGQSGVSWWLAFICLTCSLFACIKCILLYHGVSWLQQESRRLEKQQYCEAYTKELLGPRLDEDTSEIGDAAVEEAQPRPATTGWGAFKGPEGGKYDSPVAYMALMQEKHHSYESVLEDMNVLQDTEKRATKPYVFKWTGDNRDFMTTITDACWPRCNDRVKNPKKDWREYVPLPPMLQVSYVICLLLVFLLLVFGLEFANSSALPEPHAQSSGSESGSGATYEALSCPNGTYSRNTTTPGIRPTVDVFCKYVANGTTTELPCKIVRGLCVQLQSDYEKALSDLTKSAAVARAAYEFSLVMKDGFIFGTVIAFIISTCLPGFVFLGYKKKILELRTQHISGYFMDHDEYAGLYYTTYMVSAMVSFTALGFIIIYVASAFTYVVIADDKLRKAVWDFAWPWLTTYLVTYCFSTYFIRDYVFLHMLTDETHPNAIAMPRLFDFASLCMILIQFPNQVAASLYRVIYLLCFGIMSLFRVDLSMMPRGMETFDSGFIAFAQVSLLNERQNNPVVLVFLNSILDKDPLVKHPASAKQPPAEDTEKWGQLHAERSKVIDAVTDYRYNECWEEEDEADENTLKLRRMRCARNRWTLALLLMQNPSLRKYRKHRLYVPPTEDEEKDAPDCKQDATISISSTTKSLPTMGEDGVEMKFRV